MVGDPPLGKVVGAHPLGTVAAADLTFAFRRAFGLHERPLAVEKPGPEHLQRLGLVLVLGLLILLLDDDAGRDVGDANGGIRGVHRLAARPLRAEHIDTQILLVDLDIHLFGLRQHRHGRRRGVNAALGLGFGHALDPVDA